MTEKMHDDMPESKVYEIGYWLSPLIAEERVGQHVTEIKDMLDTAGAQVIGEEFPQDRALAYPITHSVEHKNTVFSKGYFGWIKFELTPDKVKEAENFLKNNVLIFRYILIRTVKENTMSQRRVTEVKKGDPVGEKAPQSSAEGDLLAKSKKVDKDPLSEEDLDKTIDDLVIE